MNKKRIKRGRIGIMIFLTLYILAVILEVSGYINKTSFDIIVSGLNYPAVAVMFYSLWGLFSKEDVKGRKYE